MSTSNIKSTALETEVSMKLGLGNMITQVLMRYGLLILTLLLIVVFSATTDTFFSMLTLQAILSEKSVVAILALAAMVTMVTGKMNLNVGFGVTFWHVLVITLQQRYGFSWEAAALTVVLCGCLYGALNGMLVALADIDSFVATLGTGTVIYAVSLWHTDGRQIVGALPESFYNLSGYELFGLPVVVFYLAAITFALWLLTEYTALGRKLYAVGANPNTATLNGINTKACYIGSYVVSDGLIAFASVLLASHIGIGSSSVGQDFMLPALVGAFLGSTTFRAGRVNVWGTIIGVSLVSVGISGLQQLGTPFFVEPLFNGAILLVAITLAGFSQKRKQTATKNNIKVK
ncbi:ABC transporter permease [Psychromonas sp. 14N.309.X.WAT.B.A12]|uniref:ABC transporter permease n=1 Tax=Psychromonas sp. 14N.309.X.WAT.B.A12 TaxID=2998322 RepID=UPI0025B20A67|nr:ABC transporter permease [Psychromonas sp. 14N.309.X.WAT.B.A12]MDN2664854.1 ABC transporter permease [Psychromonas sp. 14N.309.X.WAT.B.A12]